MGRSQHRPHPQPDHHLRRRPPRRHPRQTSPTLTASASPTSVSGYQQTTAATAGPITGSFDAAQAATVLVNGIAATLDRRTARYTLPSLNLFPGINRITIEEQDANGLHLRFAYLDIWRDIAPTAKSGTLAASTTWTAAGGPYQLTGDMPIGDGVNPHHPARHHHLHGPRRQLHRHRHLTPPSRRHPVCPHPLHPPARHHRRLWSPQLPNRQQREPPDLVRPRRDGAGKTIGSHTATLHDNAAKILIDHCTFTNSDAQDFSSDAGSFIISNSYFQTYSRPAGYPPANGTAGFGRPEMLHGVNGLPPGGYGIFKANLFGHTFGLNDIIDFTGGNHPGP